jgi:hypothetical protein
MGIDDDGDWSGRDGNVIHAGLSLDPEARLQMSPPNSKSGHKVLDHVIPHNFWTPLDFGLL